MLERVVDNNQEIGMDFEQNDTSLSFGGSRNENIDEFDSMLNECDQTFDAINMGQYDEPEAAISKSNVLCYLWVAIAETQNPSFRTDNVKLNPKNRCTVEKAETFEKAYLKLVENFLDKIFKFKKSEHTIYRNWIMNAKKFTKSYENLVQKCAICTTNDASFTCELNDLFSISKIHSCSKCFVDLEHAVLAQCLLPTIKNIISEKYSESFVKCPTVERQHKLPVYIYTTFRGELIRIMSNVLLKLNIL